MKKKYLTLAILVMVVATIVSVAIVSCKKEDNATLLGSPEKVAFTPPQVDDMNTYLKDFKQKMLSATKGDDEMLSLEEAAWHLACLTNFEHCNICVHFNDVRFDTLDLSVDIINGHILMRELNTAYEIIWHEIEKFQAHLNLEGQNLRFVNLFISENGEVRIIMMTTFLSEEKDSDGHLWYFPNNDYCDSICDIYFDEYASYQWSTPASTKLQQIINVIDGNLIIPNSSLPSYYTPTRSYNFFFNVWVDPYNSPFSYNSRLFCHYYTGNVPNIYLDKDKMCYCIDSYLGIGEQYLSDFPSGYTDERPVYWTIQPITSSQIIFHLLTVQYGKPNTDTPNPQPEE